MMALSITISDLPNEVIQQIYVHLAPQDIVCILLVNQRFNRLVDELLWRRLCSTSFKYWRHKHQIKAKLTGEAIATNWKELYVQRHLADKSTSAALNCILSSQTGRIDKLQMIVDHGYDAKDTLLRHYDVSEHAEDFLARRYYSNAILGCLHRMMAIEQWNKLRHKESSSLERALTAFDMFVLHDQDGDFDDVSKRFDELAQDVKRQGKPFGQLTTRQKSLRVANYLRENSLTGFTENRDYRDLRNAFLGIALHSEDHSSLPLISVAIFCCICERLGINAAPCGFPFHVYAIVNPPEGEDLDGKSTKGKGNPIYFDPFNSAAEVPVGALLARLTQLRALPSTFDHYLSASTLEETVLRNARNILNSVQEAHQNAIGQQMQQITGENGVRSVALSSPDLESSSYSVLWASLLLGTHPTGEEPTRQMWRSQYLRHLIEHFETHFPTDISLLEKNILPLFENTGEYARPLKAVREARSVDSVPRVAKRRTSSIAKKVKYKVGQVFHHKRYHYEAVITGWDVECGADENWIRQMRVHDLSKGKQQSFYHVLVEDKSVRYVAEENIEVVNPGIPNSLMRIAGRHFKRWDRRSQCFISNVKDEYPDD